MKNSIITWTIGVTAALVLLVLTSVTRPPEPRPALSEVSNQINLALREIADQLLQQNQDFQTLIPPVTREAEGSYLIRLGAKVAYSNLRSVVDAVLDRHHIRPDYRVSLLNCDNGIVELGFLALAEDKDKEVPCQAREQTTECFNLRLTLIEPGGGSDITPIAGLIQPLQWLFLGLAVTFPIIWLFRGKKSPASPLTKEEIQAEGWIVKSEFTAFHPLNQTLKIKDQIVELTFREAKLLQFFFEHGNQVLERERILQAVWEDEGIIVGRSLDVFVSRLRKKLKGDPQLQIVNVHGVGYRLML